MNPTRGFTRPSIAWIVIAALALAIASPTLAADSAALEGRVFAADGVTPRAEVVVALARGEDGPLWESAPTGTDGAFRLDGAPDGEYALLVRDGDRVYVAADRFPVAEGRTVPVALTLQPNLAPAQVRSGGKLPRWGQWLIAGAVLAAGAYAVNEVTKDDTEPVASPF